METDLIMLYGNNGNNVITGFGGNDLLSGGMGNDMYMFARNDGKDVLLIR